MQNNMGTDHQASHVNTNNLDQGHKEIWKTNQMVSSVPTKYAEHSHIVEHSIEKKLIFSNNFKRLS